MDCHKDVIRHDLRKHEILHDNTETTLNTVKGHNYPPRKQMLRLVKHIEVYNLKILSSLI